MSRIFDMPGGVRFNLPDDASDESARRALKDFRYVVASVNDSALRVWADLWKEMADRVTTNGLVTPNMQQGFTPECGWAEFLEKFWLLKHYLDYTNRFCREAD